MFDIWLPINSSSSLTGTMDAVTLNNSLATDTSYFEDEENGLISQVYLLKVQPIGRMNLI